MSSRVETDAIADDVGAAGVILPVLVGMLLALGLVAFVM